MINFPFNEVSGLTMKLHNLQKGVDHDKGHYVYRVSIDPNACSFEVHTSVPMFKDVLATYPVGSFKVETSYLDRSVHLSASVDGSIVLACCVMNYNMVLVEEDYDKPIEQLYKEWAERTGWPYASKN